VAVAFLIGSAESIFLEAWRPILPSHTLWMGVIAALGALAILVCVGAYVSLLIARLSPTSYVTDTHGQYSSFVSTYVWHFFEVTRLIQMGTTFGIDKPAIRPTSWLGGLPLLVFKLIALGVSFMLLAKAWTLAVDRYQAWRAPW
jgi:divalent metal cation (Fe/Co/Zn/Cd) transporter